MPQVSLAGSLPRYVGIFQRSEKELNRSKSEHNRETALLCFRRSNSGAMERSARAIG